MFDLDGVLVDSEPVWEQVRRAVVAEHGGRWTPEAQRRLMGMSTLEWAEYLSADLGVGRPPREVAALVVERMHERYRERMPLMPGAVEAVRALASRWALGVASSSPPALLDAVLVGAGLRPLFDVVVSTEQVARGKPAPDVYLVAAGRLGVEPASCVAVEDSTNGLRSARSAGMQVVAVPHPAYPPDRTALALARLILPDLHGLTPDVVATLA